MNKSTFGPIIEDKPIKLAFERSGALHRDLVAHADFPNSQHVS
ncbi:DUF2274 domain-containing protein [Rhodoligotrophos ferricapiens]|jgi:hypothetical protein